MADSDYTCWPHWLPVPEKDGFKYDPKNTNTRTEMDAGVLVRHRFKTDQTIISCQVIMHDCEISWLEAFEAEWLDQGSEWFLMPLWVAGDIQYYLAQFVDRPNVHQVRGNENWVGLTLRIRSRILAAVPGIDYGSRNTLIEWPSDLPVLQDTYSYEVRKTDMQGATDLPTSKRPELRIDEVSIKGRMSLNTRQIAKFEWFERDILNEGARWFKMPVWIGGELKNYIVRFIDRPKMTLSGFWTDVSFQLELEQRQFMHPQVVQWLRALSPDELFFFLEQFHSLLHEKMPGLTIIPDGVYIKV